MLINCPRCGFQQPEDLFCAQCGVNISKVSDKKTNPFIDALKSKAIWVLPVAILAGAGVYISQLPPQSASQQISSISTDNQSRQAQASSKVQTDSIGETEQKPIKNYDTYSQASQESGSETSNSTSVPSNSEALGVAVNNSTRSMASDENTDAEFNAANELGESLRLRVEYIEISKAELAKFIETTSKENDIIDLSEYSLGVVSAKYSKIKSLPSVKVLHSDEIDLSQSRSQIWNYSTADKADPRRFTGFRTLLEASDIDYQKKTLRGHLEIQSDIKIPRPPEGPALKSFPAVFELNAENSFLMAGILPHDGDLKLNAEAIKSIDSLAIMNSHAFRVGQTEFLILIYLE